MDKLSSPNSFYRLGDMDIITFAQDEVSLLYKFYLSTPEHYVVSREFDKSHGLYADAPEAVIRRGLMDFSASITGTQLSLYDIMDMFIDRCFDDSIFDKYTGNAVWMCIDYPSYEEVEDILSTYCSRLKWYDKSDVNNPLGEYMNTALYKTPNGDERTKLIRNIRDEFERLNITTAFMNNDVLIEPFIHDKGFGDFPIFMGQFSDKNNEQFISFNYIPKD